MSVVLALTLDRRCASEGFWLQLGRRKDRVARVLGWIRYPSPRSLNRCGHLAALGSKSAVTHPLSGLGWAAQALAYPKDVDVERLGSPPGR